MKRLLSYWLRASNQSFILNSSFIFYLSSFSGYLPGLMIMYPTLILSEVV